MGNPVWGSDPSLLEENLCNCNYPLVCRSLVMWALTPCPSHLPVVGPCLYLQLQKTFSARLHIFLMKSYFVNSCYFGVPFGGGELLLCSVAESCLALYDPMDCSPPDSSVHGISQARVLEWVAISFFRGSSHPGIEFKSPSWQADSLLLDHLGSPTLNGERSKASSLNSTIR